jgi:L-amino acid N-acyltransferase YncA
MNILVREARVEDALDIIEVLNPIIEARANSVLTATFSEQEERDFMAQFPKRGIFHVAVNSDQSIIGFQTVEPFGAYTPAFDHVGIIGTFVSMSHQKQGVGTSLFQATFQAAILKGYEKLFAYVRADNTAGLTAYLGQGFGKVGIAKNHAKIDGRYVDEIIIERFLSIQTAQD